MIWLKVDGIKFKPESKEYSSYNSTDIYELLKPEVMKIKVKIGDTTLEGTQLGEIVMVDDEKLNNALTIAEARKEAYEQGYDRGKERGKVEGYRQGYKRALKECAEFIGCKREEYDDE